MASVRLTEELRGKIKRNAMDKFELANPEPKISNEQMVHLRNAVTESKVQKYFSSVSRLAKAADFNFDWDKSTYRKTNYEVPAQYNDITRLEMSWDRDHVIDGVVTDQVREEIEIELDSPITLFGTPSNYSTHYRNNANTVHVDVLQDHHKTQTIETLNSLHSAISTKYTTQREYESQIKELLDECTTLKQLLDIWSAAESLVPPEYLQRMRIKVTRATRAKEIKDNVSFDATLANQTILTAKVLGG